ncbi:nuclear transport factor 2 family protein [Sphingomicrobium sediminis]|uniref:Nuclear transport factor 2 family protein n=1 Tax=Sphingomicrobium sediminis TaxID=2950949 RepID=A0A9X2EGN4_9SPHN|nr:nuclear transport factor 2 family protein [Sphingomicrobium sediminis]MCM8557046.1 nuclear transport factor 2 family protein [Sphingomicrobium sediminis]
MADIASVIETHEHQIWRAWIQRDVKAMKKLTSRNMMMVVGAGRAQLLDRASWVQASTAGFTCSGYRLRDILVRKHGSSVWFTATAELEMELDGEPWKGDFWLTDLWQRSTVTRKWALSERSISRTVVDERVPKAIRQLQLWR